MRYILSRLRTKEYLHFFWVFAAALALSIHYALIVYIASDYIAQYVGQNLVSPLYTAGSLLTLMVLVSGGETLRHFGNRTMMLWMIIVEAICLGVMAVSGNIAWVVPLFVLHQAVAPILLFNLDIFLEGDINKRSHVGGLRGMFLTMSNMGYVIGPMVVALVLDSANPLHPGFWKVYGIAFAMLIPLLYIVWTKFRRFEDPHYTKLNILPALRSFFKNKKLAPVFWCNFVLQTFYVCMVIYIPLHLVNLGFTWSAIGQMFTIALLPFIMFQIPGGALADKDGERDILIWGLIGMGLPIVIASFITVPSFLIWTALMFVSRVGAAVSEVMIESSFFRHVQGKDAEFISVFRMTSPLAYVAMPLFFGTILWFSSYNMLFLALGLLCIGSIYFAKQIAD